MTVSSLRARVTLAALALASACGSPPPEVPPEAPVVAAPAISWLEAGSPPVVPPSIPWLETGSPIERPCPGSWSSTGDRCAPWVDAIPACAGATIRAPGEPACRPLSPSCPPGDFPSGLPPATLHVLAGAAAGGDGSLALPFATLGEALASASPGATIALSRGTHDVSGPIDLDVSLRGACASETIILATGSVSFAIGASLAIEDLTMRPGDANDPIFVEGAHEVSIHRVLLEGGRGYGITASGGAHVELADVRVAGVGVRINPGEPVWSAGIVAQSGGVLSGARVVVDAATWVGASADQGRISLTDSVLRGTHEDPALSDSAGATCWEGGTIELTRTVLESNVSRGLEELAGCVLVTLEDVVIRSTRRGASAVSYGMLVGAPAVAHGLGLFDNAESAVVALLAGHGELSDVVVDGVSGEGTGLAGAAGGTLVIQRAIVRGVTAGLYVATDGSVDAEDLHIEHVEGSAALSVASPITLRRAVIGDVDSGLFAGGSNASIIASDVVIERVGAVGQPDSDAITARAGGRVEVQRAVVHDAMGTVVAAVQESAVAIVRDLTCTGGGSAFVALTGTVEVTQADVAATNEPSAWAASPGSRIALTDVRIHDVVVSGPRTGAAMLVQDGAELELAAVLVERAAFAIVGEATSVDQAAPRLLCEDAVFRELSGPALELASATAELSRVQIVSASDAALIARGTAVHVTLADVTISELLGRSDGRLGRGLHVGAGATIDGSQVTITAARGVGLFASDPGTRVTLDDVWIAGTLEEACGASCATRAAGHGVASLFEAQVTLTSFRVSDSAWAGVLVADDGDLVLTNGFVDGNRVGRAVLGAPPTGYSASSVVYSANDVLEAREDVVVPPASLL